MSLSNVRMADLLDAAPDAIVVADSSGKIILINVQAEALFGYARQDLLGHAVEVLLPDRLRTNHIAHRTAFVRAPTKRPMGIGLELFARHKSGDEFPVEISLSPLETDAGLLIMSGIRDITDRKIAEAALIDARQDAERANRAKSAFLAAASHDLRQPVQALNLLNRVLARTSPPGSKAAEVAAIQQEAISSMSDLLNSLLDISKLEAGAVKPDIRDCSVRSIFERIHAQFSSGAEAKGLKLFLDECDDIVRTDPTLLAQIVQNLVANAIRYTERGHVHLRCPDTGATIHIEVVDTGSGIPPDQQQMIFEDFYQIPREAGERKEGLGLGLSIVRRTADLLGHAIKVDSTVGEGSCFAIEIPKGEPQRAAMDATTPELSSDAPRGVVLIVDDETAIVDAMAMLLELEGHKSVVAASFDEAQAKLRAAERMPDAIICDFHLAGGESGLETIHRIRRIVARPIPAILMTGDTSTIMSHMLADIANCHLVSKPVDGDALLALLDEVLDGAAV